MLRLPAACVMIVIGAVGASAQPDVQPRPLLFQNARVFDGADVKLGVDVLARGETIEAVGRDLQVPENAQVIDGTGKTLLPGLIDCHTHAFLETQLEQATVFGVTTELDMAGNPAFAAEMRSSEGKGALVRADLLSAGTPVTAQGGHPTQLPWFGEIPTIGSPEEAPQFVADRIAEGSDYIKVIYDDGSAYGARLPTITRETLQAVVREAHRQDKLAVAHVSTRKGMRDAVSAGVDGVVHLFIDEPIDNELVQLVRSSGAFAIPTLTVLQSATGVASGAALVDDPALKRFLLQDDIVNLRSAFPQQDDSSTDYAVARRAAAELHSAGVPILAGSDAPNPGTAHGVSLHRELELLVEAGLTPIEALTAATSQPAERFGLSDRGRLSVGLRADLVLVEGNPDVDIKKARQIRGVWKGGRRVDRETYRRRIEASRSVVAHSADGGRAADPKDRLISDFDGDEIEASFGSGWSVSTDVFVGGKSTAKLELSKEGAQETSGSLRITGSVEERPEPRWAGVSFSPGVFPMAPANLSDHEGLSFWTKGDGKTYYVMLFFQKRGFTPSFKTFRAGNDWKLHQFAFEDFDGCDGSDVLGIFFGSGPETGDFRLQIDQVGLE